MASFATGSQTSIPVDSGPSSSGPPRFFRLGHVVVLLESIAGRRHRQQSIGTRRDPRDGKADGVRRWFEPPRHVTSSRG